MNGLHDVGGMHGLGRLVPDTGDEAVFGSRSQARVFALTIAAGALGRWSLDASRHARERLGAVDQLRLGYFERWLAGLTLQLRESGVVTADELASGNADGPAPEEVVARRLTPERAGRAVERGRRSDLEAATAPRFTPGQRVRVRPHATPGHTRAVRYAQGRFGEVRVHHGCHVFPDRNARGERVGEHLYGVAFDARELWGGSATGHTVHVDLWEPYLEEAP